MNSVKAGAAVPVKFTLGGDQGLNVFAAGYPRTQQVLCSTNTLIDAVEETVSAGGSGLSYDAVTEQYTFVWKTDKAWANTCLELQVKFADGQLHTARFSLSR